MDKKGQKNGAFVWIVLAVIVFYAYSQGAFTGQASDQTSTTVPPYISTGSTTITLSAVDAAQPGVLTGGTTKVSVDGTAYVTDDFSISASPNQVLNVLVVNGTTYHNQVVQNYKVPASPTASVEAKLNANATSIQMTVFNSNSVALTNGGGAVNETVATGQARSLNMRIDGQDKTSTQDMRCILEATDSSKANLLQLTNFPGVAKVDTGKPNWYTLAGASSGVWVYDISAITGVTSATGTLSYTSQSGQSMANTKAIVDCYTKEWFLDTNDGTVKFGVEDSLQNLKSMAHYKFTVQFV